MTRRLDLTPAPIMPKMGDFSVWLTRDALLGVVYSEARAEFEDDRDSAQCWLVRDAARQVGLTHNLVRSLDEVQHIKRILRERRGGAQ